MNLSPSYLIDSLAAFAVGGSAGAKRESILLQMADSVISYKAARRSREGTQIHDFFLRDGNTPLTRICADASVLRLSEIDTIHRASCVTSAALSIPVVWHLTDSASFQAMADSELAIDAAYVGQEIAIGVAMACGGAKIMSRGLWPSYLVAPIGAAAVAGRMLGLSEPRMRHALTMAIAQCTGAGGKTSGERPGRWMIFGDAVRRGCLAALAAQDGIDGDVALLDRTWLDNVAGIAGTADAEWITSIGTGNLVDEISFKPHCSAKQALSSIHGLRQLLDDGVTSQSISSIAVSVPTAYAAMIDRKDARSSRIASMVSAPWQLALTALKPELLDDVARDSIAEDASLVEFAKKVTVKADASLDALYPQQYAARLVVELHDESQFREIFVRNSPGDPELGFDADDVLDKCRRVLGNAEDESVIRDMLGANQISSQLPEENLLH